MSCPFRKMKAIGCAGFNTLKGGASRFFLPLNLVYWASELIVASVISPQIPIFTRGAGLELAGSIPGRLTTDVFILGKSFLRYFGVYICYEINAVHNSYFIFRGWCRNVLCK